MQDAYTPKIPCTFSENFLKTLIQNIRIQSFSPGNRTNYKIQNCTDKKSPYNSVDSSDMDVVCGENISCNRADTAAYCRLLRSLLPEQTTNERSKEGTFQTAKRKHIQQEYNIRRIDCQNHHNCAKHHRKNSAHKLYMLLIRFIFHRIILHHIVLP